MKDYLRKIITAFQQKRASNPLHSLDFQGSNLAGADLRGIDLTGVNLRKANLTAVRLGDTLLQGALLECATFQGVCIQDLLSAGLSARDLFSLRALDGHYNVCVLHFGPYLSLRLTHKECLRLAREFEYWEHIIDESIFSLLYPDSNWEAADCLYYAAQIEAQGIEGAYLSERDRLTQKGFLLTEIEAIATSKYLYRSQHPGKNDDEDQFIRAHISHQF